MRLSKSRYISGCQCPLKLWYECHEPQLAELPGVVQQAIFDTGNAVGALARERYQGGHLVEFGPRQPEQAMAKTAELMADPSVEVIFEGAFLYKDVLVRVDVLERKAMGWNLIEVKSGTKVKDGVHDRDVAVQLWVLRGSDVAVVSSGVLTLNREYVYDGVNLNLDRLFKFHDISELAAILQTDVEQEIQRSQEMLHAASAPDIDPGEQCSKPYKCQYYAHCTRNLVTPEHPLSEIPKLHKNKSDLLESDGIDSIVDVPVDFPLTGRQAIVRDAVVNDEEYISEDLAVEITNVTYPIYYLDFETFSPAIPRYAGTHPYQLIPFQFSVHIERAKESLQHIEYLHEDDGDPRRLFAGNLLSTLGREGSICVYTSYERRVIQELAKAVPELSDQLTALLDRLWDLCKVIEDYYYHKDFGGSYSIKKVLPVLVPELSYATLSIQDGLAAAAVYERALNSEYPEERQKTFSDLKEYCGLDTLAMVRLREEILSITNMAERRAELVSEES